MDTTNYGETTRIAHIGSQGDLAASVASSAESDVRDRPGRAGLVASRLGRLERDDLRTVWADESDDFTPWLAQPENIILLSEALGLKLELEAKEKSVGPFRADILCRDIDSEHRVLIENQLERTNHVHLGQLLTYASGLEAVTIVWIAARFTEEHRAALDWLNRITGDNVRFFGLEVELWRIGDSLAAPKFNVISQPNRWSHTVAQVVRAMDEAELSDIRLLQRDYWAAFMVRLDQIGGPVTSNKKPQPQAYMNFPIGRGKIRLNVAMIRPSKQIRVALNLCGVNAKLFFRLLLSKKQEIEKDFNHALEWHEMPDGQESRIAYYLDNVAVEDRADWPRQHQWLSDHINTFYRVFARRVSQLDTDGEEAEAEVA